MALWAYCTSHRTSIGFTPFSLVYGSKAILPAEVLVPTARLALQENEEEVMVSRIADLKLIEGKRELAQKHLMRYTQKTQTTYNKKVKIRGFLQDDLVLLGSDHVMKGLHATKFTPNWEGPYKISEIKTKKNGYCKLEDLHNERILKPTNINFIKKYYP